jgi:hypothetical protein
MGNDSWGSRGPSIRAGTCIDPNPPHQRKQIESLGGIERCEGLDGRFSVTFGFPRAKTGVDQEIAAERLLKGKWSDLAPARETDAGGDEVMFTSDRREVLEDLVRRAIATKVA